jgi:hypothetical protein
MTDDPWSGNVKPGFCNPDQEGWTCGSSYSKKKEEKASMMKDPWSGTYRFKENPTFFVLRVDLDDIRRVVDFCEPVEQYEWNLEDALKVLGDTKGMKRPTVAFHKDRQRFSLETATSKIVVYDGDYIVKYNNTFRAYTPAEFEATFERVEP